MDERTRDIIATRRDRVMRVKKLLIDSLQLDLEPDEIAEDSPLFGFGLGLDSIDALTLVVAVEDQFGVPVPDENLHLFRSVNTIADFLMRSTQTETTYQAGMIVAASSA